jgi:hypothetical protein
VAHAHPFFPYKSCKESKRSPYGLVYGFSTPVAEGDGRLRYCIFLTTDDGKGGSSSSSNQNGGRRSLLTKGDHHRSSSSPHQSSSSSSKKDSKGSCSTLDLARIELDTREQCKAAMSDVTFGGKPADVQFRSYHAGDVLAVRCVQTSAARARSCA